MPLTMLSGLGHWWLGNVDCVLLGTLLSGSLPGVFVGSHVAHRLPERALRPTLAGMLVLVGAKLMNCLKPIWLIGVDFMHWVAGLRRSAPFCLGGCNVSSV